MPRLVVPLLTALVALALVVSAEAAQVTTLPAGTGIGGNPAFAGDGLVVVEEGAIDDEVVLRAADGSRRVLAGPVGFERSAADWFTVVASADRFAVSQSRPAKGGEYFPAAVQGPLAGPAAPSPCPTPAIAISGRAFGHHCRREVVVDDPDVGERRFAVEQGRTFALAGRFLAHRTEGEVVVLDRVTGREELRVPAPRRYPRYDDALDVDDDGTVAFSDDTGVAWASPREPSPHRLSGRGQQVRVAGGRVAIASTASNSSFHDVQVRTLADEPLGEVRLLRPRSWDFDGRRLVYFQTPCALTSLVIFEPGAEAAPSLGTRCGRAAIRTRSVPLRTNREVTITVSCPRSATAGCGYSAELCAPRLPFVCADRQYAGLPGATDRLRLRFTAEEAAQIRRARVRQLTLTVGATKRRVAVR